MWPSLRVAQARRPTGAGTAGGLPVGAASTGAAAGRSAAPGCRCDRGMEQGRVYPMRCGATRRNGACSRGGCQLSGVKPGTGCCVLLRPGLRDKQM